MQRFQRPPKQIFTLRGHVHAITQLAGTANDQDDHGDAGNVLFSGDADGWVRAWDVGSTKRSLWSHRLHPNASILSLVVTRSSWLITHARDGRICVWPLLHRSIDPLKPVFRWTTKHVGFCSCAWLEEMQLLAVPDENKIVCYSLQDVSGREEKPMVELPWNAASYGMLMTMHVRRNGNAVLLLAGSESGHVVGMDVLSGGDILFVAPIQADPVMAMAVSMQHDWLFACSPAFRMVKWQPGQEQRSFGEKENAPSDKTSLSLKASPLSIAIRSQDERILAVGCADGNVRLFRTKDSKYLGTLEIRAGGSVQSVFFLHGKPSWLAVGAENGNISLWQVY